MHHHRAEHWIVVSGSAKVTNGEQTFLLSENESKSMNFFIWTLWLLLGFVAAYLTTPSSDVFTGSYSEGISTASDNSGLDSLLLMGHLVLIFCFYFLL